ncbi:MAG TPA: hypothetical protein VF026_32620, partial [Ktedonobacteraceae bacterium]
EVPDGWQAWIVVRRSLSDPTEMVFHRVCAPKETTLPQIVDVAGARWKVEDAIERGKGECGLDQYEVRSWTGWYRHITLSLVAQFCATLMMDQANAEQEKKPGSRTLARAVCTASSAGEDWPSVDPLHLARSASLDLAAGLSAGDHARSHPGLVVVSASSSGCGSSLSLQTAVSSQSILTPTVVLGIKVQLAGIGQVISLSLEHSLPMKPG